MSSAKSSDNLLNLCPTEIWAMIIDIVGSPSIPSKLRWDFWGTLRSLNLSCRFFHHIVSPVLFSTVRIHFPLTKRPRAFRFQTERPARPLPYFLSEPPRRSLGPCIDKSQDNRTLHPFIKSNVGQTVFHHVRILVISYGLGYEEENHSQPIQRLVENLRNLDTIRWRGIPFPSQLVQILHGRQVPPQIYYEGSPQAIISESLLIGAFYIKSLSITCIPALQEHITNELGKVILSLPKLERLVLKQVANHYWRDNSTPISPTFRLDADTKLPPSLRILSLANFTFNEEQAIAWARCITECDIQHLRLDGYLQISVLLKALSGFMPGLKSFASRVISEPDVLRSSDDFLAILDCFLQSITDLECFTSNDLPKGVLTSVIRHHGNHLRQLRFRQTSSIASIFPRSEGKICLFSLEEIVQLANGLAQVERLGLDLLFKDTTPYDYLEALARFPSLKYLELNTPNFCAVPSLGESIIKEAFQYVGARTERCLAGLDIKVGEWERLFHGSKNKALIHNNIYTAWRESNVPNLVHVAHLPCRLGSFSHLAEDSMFEQTMHSAGLWPLDRVSSGPGIW